jgi:hypothetical protein
MDHVSSSESSQNQDSPALPTFEETYPRYEFAEMVRIGLVVAEWLAAAAEWLAKVSRGVQRPRSGISSKPLPGEVHPAE